MHGLRSLWLCRACDRIPELSTLLHSMPSARPPSKHERMPQARVYHVRQNRTHRAPVHLLRCVQSSSCKRRMHLFHVRYSPPERRMPARFVRVLRRIRPHRKALPREASTGMLRMWLEYAPNAQSIRLSRAQMRDMQGRTRTERPQL